MTCGTVRRVQPRPRHPDGIGGWRGCASLRAALVWTREKPFVPANGDELDLGPVRPHIGVEPVAGRDVVLGRVIEEMGEGPMRNE